jgi:parvulin-like peptidyl-prolyl isomerase
MKEMVFTRASEGRIKVDEAEVEAFYAKRAEQITARHIVIPTFAEANAIRDSLEAGASFGDLALNYSTCVSGANQGYLGPVRWGDFSERWSAQAFALEPGEISEPFEVEDGYCLVTVETRTMADLADPEAEKQAIRNRLLRDAIFEERKSYLDSLNLGYNVQTDVNAVIELCLRYADTLEDLGLTAEVVDINVTPPLTEADKQIPVVTFDGGAFDYEDVVNMINAQPYVVRPNLDDPEQMLGFLGRQMNDSLLIWEAYKLGYDKDPELVDELEKLEQKRTLMRFYNYIAGTVEVPEDTVRLFYENRKEEFRIQPGHYGSKLEDLAREHSIDMFTAPQGGDMGFVVRGKDEEFDGFFDTMEEGEMAIFRSVEGHVILWLKKRQEEKAPTFEEARAAAEESLRPAYKARALKDWVAERREELNLKINEDLLSRVELGS